jgi:hypothetical protein
MIRNIINIKEDHNLFKIIKSKRGKFLNRRESLMPEIVVKIGLMVKIREA